MDVPVWCALILTLFRSERGIGGIFAHAEGLVAFRIEECLVRRAGLAPTCLIIESGTFASGV